MAALREIKDRIFSVKSTLKITSAMKLVASSKLRKAQRQVEAMRPYEEALSDILLEAGGSCAVQSAERENTPRTDSHTIIVAISSNSSLCGGFNVNAAKKAYELATQYKDVEVWSVGRKMADIMKKAGYPSPENFNDLVARASFAGAQKLAASLVSAVNGGKAARVILVYNHFVSSSRQQVVSETFLPMGQTAVAVPAEGDSEFIIEPGAAQLVETLRPQVLNVKMYAAILDSIAAEHAARTVAMQMATENAETLLSELTLAYNKSRQDKITNELLDLAGGMIR